MIYKGVQNCGVYQGIGELLKKEILKDEEELEDKEFLRIYLGEFSDGKPSGEGILYFQDGRKIKYRG